MPLIKNQRWIDDSWATVTDEDPLPALGPVIVSLERWRAEREALIRRDGPLGIRLRSDQSPEAIAVDLRYFDVVALEFAKFTDGRPYSSARLLRERYHYRGEVRAVGEVLRDQFLFIDRCGFDAVEVPAGAELGAWLGALAEVEVFYQPAADTRATALALRHRRVAAAE